MMVAAITARQWNSLLDAIDGHEAMGHVEAMLGVDLSDEGRRFEARDLIAPIVARWIGVRDYEEVRAALDEAGVCWGPYQSFLEMVRGDARCSTRNPMFEDVDQPGIGRFMMPGSPLEFRPPRTGAGPPCPDSRTAHRRDPRGDTRFDGCKDRCAPRTRNRCVRDLGDESSPRENPAIPCRALAIRCSVAYSESGRCRVPLPGVGNRMRPGFRTVSHRSSTRTRFASQSHVMWRYVVRGSSTGMGDFRLNGRSQSWS